MSRATSLISRIGVILNKVNPTDRKIYKRVVKRTGGDQLLGVPANIENVDIQLDPPPIFSRVGRNIVGQAVNSEAFDVDGAIGIGNDYMLTVSPAAISWAEFGNKDLLIVFKDSDMNEEVFRITDFEPVAFQGIDVLIIAFIKSTSRNSP